MHPLGELALSHTLLCSDLAELVLIAAHDGSPPKVLLTRLADRERTLIATASAGRDRLTVTRAD